MTTPIQAAATYRHFRIEEVPVGPRRKTTPYRIVNRTSGDCIGFLEWYGPWRQHCLLPVDGTVWSAGCLQDVRCFLDRLAADRRAKK